MDLSKGKEEHVRLERLGLRLYQRAEVKVEQI